VQSPNRDRYSKKTVSGANSSVEVSYVDPAEAIGRGLAKETGRISEVDGEALGVEVVWSLLEMFDEL